MLSPQAFAELGVAVADELVRLSSDFHVKDDRHDELANAADAVRAKTDEVASLLLLPGLQEKLANSTALRQAAALPPASSLEQRHGYFEYIYQGLNATLAQAIRELWVGEWELNDDGLASKLRVTDRSSGSKYPELPNLEIAYEDAGGQVYHGSVRSIDARGHHLHFFVCFGETSRQFDAYLFWWNKRALAGVSEGRGFSATKRDGNEATNP